jgi:cytochrome c5
MWKASFFLMAAPLLKAARVFWGFGLSASRFARSRLTAAAALLFLAPGFSSAQGANMAQGVENCTASCHGPSLIAQQRLDRDAWGREVDKMMRWGAEVPAAEKDALVNYLATLFNSSRSRPNTGKVIPEGKGADVFQISCMSCHDDRPVAALKRDRTAWAREIEKMTNWGAYVPAERRDELIEYLMTAFSSQRP